MASADPAFACEPADEPEEGTLSMDVPAKDAAAARPGKEPAVMRVCSLLSVKLPRRGC